MNALRNAFAWLRRHLQLAMLHTRHSQLLLLQAWLDLLDVDPVEVKRCAALLADVELQIHLLTTARRTQ